MFLDSRFMLLPAFLADMINDLFKLPDGVLPREPAA